MARDGLGLEHGDAAHLTTLERYDAEWQACGGGKRSEILSGATRPIGAVPSWPLSLEEATQLGHGLRVKCQWLN